MPPPFWSPDGRFVAFDSGGKLKKLDVTGGPAQALSDLPTLAVGGSWNLQGDIIVGNAAGGLLRVRETGGTASPVTALNPSRKEEFHLLPTFLPDGRHFVYLRVAPGAPDNGGVYVGTLDATPEAQSTQRLMPYAVGLTYAASGDSGPGRLLFLREGTLMAQPFDAKRLSLAGDSVPVAERVGSFRDGGFFLGLQQWRPGLSHRRRGFSGHVVRPPGHRDRPCLGTRRLSRRGPFPGWRPRSGVAHESAGRDESRPVAARSVAWQRIDTIDAWRRHGRVSCLVHGRHAHHLHARQQPAPSETRKRRGRRGGTVAIDQWVERQGVRLVA